MMVLCLLLIYVTAITIGSPLAPQEICDKWATDEPTKRVPIKMARLWLRAEFSVAHYWLITGSILARRFDWQIVPTGLLVAPCWLSFGTPQLSTEPHASQVWNSNLARLWLIFGSLLAQSWNAVIQKGAIYKPIYRLDNNWLWLAQIQ
jgi:hypothetical protein